MTLSPTDIPVRFAAARADLEAGRYTLARQALDAIEAARPGLPEVTYQRGRLLAAMGDVQAAQAAFELALAAHPKEPMIWAEVMLLAARSPESAAARDVATRAKTVGVPAPQIRMLQDLGKGQGLRASSLGGADPAMVASLSKRLAKGPDAGLARNLAALAARHPKGAVIWGLLAAAKPAGADADAAFRKGIALEPCAVDLRMARAQMLAHAGQTAAALIEARQAATFAPRLDAAQLLLARIAMQNGRAEVAVTALEPLARRAGAPVLAMLADALAATGQSDAALEQYERAIAKAPSVIGPRLARAGLLQSMGQADVAEAHLRGILRDAPECGAAYRALAYGVKLGKDDPAIAQMEAQLTRRDLPEPEARLIRFAMARAMETSGQGARVFTYLRPAKDATFAAFPYDHSLDRAATDRICTAVTERLAALPVSPSDAAPVFVTGLPRSGTTLVEQILAAHPDMTGGGELGVFSVVAAPLIDALAKGAPVGAGDLARVAQLYTEDVAFRTGAMGRITDKSIHSVLHIGVIRAVMPKARIVVVRRDPRDSGLSMYRNHFRDGVQRYTNDMEAIAQHIGLFDRLIGHWRGVDPRSFHEIRYEDLLADPEAQTRALLAACDLEWDPACLSFHTVDRRVDTLSFAQVRQPLYHSSKGGWHAYADELAPMIAAFRANGVDLPD
jgi:tetratricopeptide (TPR) repeat protein